MNSRKWRNPYAPISNKKSPEKPAEVSLAVTPRRAVPAMDLRTSVSRMRSNIKGISSTIRQMEYTMDTLYGAMEMFESLSSKKGGVETGKTTPARHLADQTDRPTESAEAEGSNPLGNLDIGQLLNLLQSPLVQNLLNQNASSSKRKKEG